MKQSNETTEGVVKFVLPSITTAVI